MGTPACMGGQNFFLHFVLKTGDFAQSIGILQTVYEPIQYNYLYRLASFI